MRTRICVRRRCPVMLGPMFVLRRARMPTHRESVLKTVSASETVVGGSNGTVSAPDTGPLDALKYGVPVNSDPWAFEKNTSNVTLPLPVAFSRLAAAVAQTESTLDLPNPGGKTNRRDTVESACG